MKKICTKCNENKDLNLFGNSINSKDGLNQRCKKCCILVTKESRRTKDGLITKIYSSQKSNSKLRKHPEPKYTKEEFKTWILSQNLFHKNYNNWIKNNYSNKTIPSVDRKDDFKPYTIDNIQISIWDKNRSKGHNDRTNANGTQGIICKKVYQYSLDKKILLNQFISTSDAGRKTIDKQQVISACCSGRTKSSKNFYWSFSML